MKIDAPEYCTVPADALKFFFSDEFLLVLLQVASKVRKRNQDRVSTEQEELMKSRQRVGFVVTEPVSYIP